MSVLDLFPTEKVAAEDQAIGKTTARSLEERSKKAIKPDRESLDPGERALAGILAGQAVAKIPRIIGGLGMAGASLSEAKSWVFQPMIDQKTIKEMMSSGGAPGKTKILNLFEVTTRPDATLLKTEAQARIRAERMSELTKEMKKIQPVVDSFIKKHKLVEKGVRMDFQRSLLSMAPFYDPLTKRVALPVVSAPIALHELGHAADYARPGGAARRVAGSIGNRAAMIALPTALIAGDKIKEMIPGSIDDKAIGFLQDHAPAIGAATLAATSFIPEVKATKFALEHIKEVQGGKAARAAAKKLLPALGTYLLSYVPVVAGLSFAKKYMNEKREQDAAIEKTSGFGGTFFRHLSEAIQDTGAGLRHAANQVDDQAQRLLRDPDMGKRLLHAAKATGSDPTFIAGAVNTAIPATLGALYFYGTPAGREIRDRMGKEYTGRVIPETHHGGPLAQNTREAWRENHPLRFAGLVGLGSALSGGIISKLLTDIRRAI